MGVLARQDHADGGDSAGAASRVGRRPKAAAFTVLELQVALVILGAGLLAMTPLMAMQSRQIRHVEAWCRSEPTFYLVSQSNRWLRRLGAPAAMEDQAGGSPWTPPVDGAQEYDLELLSLNEDLDNRTVSVEVHLVDH